VDEDKNIRLASPRLKPWGHTLAASGVFSSRGFGYAELYICTFSPALAGRGILDELVKKKPGTEVLALCAKAG